MDPMPIDQMLLRLWQTTNSITRNPLLDYFNLDDLKLIESLAGTDTFIKEKRDKIKSLIEKLSIDFNPKLKSAFDEYSEAMLYIRLKNKFEYVERIPEGAGKTPDFRIEFNAHDGVGTKRFTICAELKAMSFASNNLNYLDTMQQGIDAQISIENQLKEGKEVAFGITETAPLSNANRQYDPYSTLYAIDTLIEKIGQNLKRGQFELGDTVLVIDLRQLLFQGSYLEASIPVFTESRSYSLVSGAFWNTAFGKEGHLIYRPIEFEGEKNVDGDLKHDGILIAKDWIKAIVFLTYDIARREPKIVGLYRYRETSDAVRNFLHKFCDFTNDDMNSSVWKVTQPDSKKPDSDAL